MDGLTGQSAVFRRHSLARVAQFAATLPDDLAEVLWNRPESLVDMAQPLRFNGLRRTVHLTWGPARYVVKHYVESSWWHAVKRKVQVSRARATWSITHRLADLGIATPRPVAFIENRWGPLGQDSFLMYPYVEGRTLRTCLAVESPLMVESLWRQLRELWQRLATSRASLADTNAGNFIVSPAGRLWVIDLDKAQFHRLSCSAARHQRRGWKQLLRSAAKCERPVVSPRKSA